MSRSYDELSYCGVFCGDCRNYKQNLNCGGCRNEPEMVSDCPTRACAIARGLLHCGTCADFPCATLSDFYHDGSTFHLSAKKNMQEIMEAGVDAWLERRKVNT